VNLTNACLSVPCRCSMQTTILIFKMMVALYGTASYWDRCIKQDICGHLDLRISINIINIPLQLVNKIRARFLKSKVNVIYSFRYNQQDATLYNILYFCQCSTCFKRFLHPPSGAQKL